jgi:signal peptidase II
MMSEQKKSRNWSMLIWLVLSLVSVILDQASKYYATLYLKAGSIDLLPFLKLSLTENRGAAFGFLDSAGGWQRWFFVVIAIGFSVLLIHWLISLARSEKWSAISLSMILGGAWGNLWDRIFSPGLDPENKGAVIDFISVHYKNEYFFPTFNVADSFITVGVALLILLFILQARSERKAKHAAAGDQGM